MKSNSKFFVGLTLGLALGFVAFNVGSANSSNTNSTSPDAQIANETNVPKGKFITAAEAAPLEQNYLNYINSLGQSNASTGGVIGEGNIRDLTRALQNGDIAYKFYKTAGTGDAKVGIIFYSPNGKVLQSEAFCPTMCTTSD